jgi:hypothetical protein
MIIPSRVVSGDMSAEEEIDGDELVLGPGGGPRPTFYANGLQVLTSGVDVRLTFFIHQPGQNGAGGIDIFCSPYYLKQVIETLKKSMAQFEQLSGDSTAVGHEKDDE